MTYPSPQWLHRQTRRETYCLTALTPTRTTNVHTAKLRTTSGKTVRNSKRKRNRKPKMAKSPSVLLTQNVPLAAKQITQQRNVGVVPELTFVPKETDTTPKTRSLQRTKALSQKLRNLQHLLQVNRTPRNPIQKTNFATTPNM